MLQISLSFKGNAIEALNHYSKIFKMAMPTSIMRYKDMPPQPGYTIPAGQENLIMYAEIEVQGTIIMISDYGDDMGVTAGNNLGIAIVMKDKDELTRLFNELSDGGKIDMPMGQTFWSEQYGICTDKYGISWQFNLLKNF